MLLIDTDLDVVGHLCSGATSQGHGAAVWIGERDLAFATILHLFLKPFVLIHPLLEPLDLLLEFSCRGFVFIRLHGVVFAQLIQVGINLLLDILYGLLELAVSEVAAFVVDGFEFTSVDSNQLAAEEI